MSLLLRLGIAPNGWTGPREWTPVKGRRSRAHHDRTAAPPTAWTAALGLVAASWTNCMLRNMAVRCTGPR